MIIPEENSSALSAYQGFSLSSSTERGCAALLKFCPDCGVVKRSVRMLNLETAWEKAEKIDNRFFWPLMTIAITYFGVHVAVSLL